MADGRELYLVWHGAAAHDLEIGDPACGLQPGLLMVRTARSRSKLYHAIKRQLPPDTALLVAPLAEAPKFKGMQAGALAWLRDSG